MVDDSPEDISLAADPGRAKRPPPTIDLEASEVTTSTASPAEDAPPEAAPPEPSSPESSSPKLSSPKPARSSIATAVIAGITGAVVAALVFAGAMLAGWPEAPPAPAASAPANAAAMDDLTARLASLEARLGKNPAPAPDPAIAARVEMLDKSVAALRGEFDGLSGRSEKLAAEVNDIKTAPHETAPQAPPPDLSVFEERIAGLERAIRAQKAEITQENTKPADDVPLRRIVAAGLLDVLVRVGDPYPAALTAAKSLTPNPDELKPLEPFAETGVPSPANLCRELLTLVPKLSPAAPVAATTTGSGIVERLEAGAAKLVRIERTDTKGNDRENVVARVTAAALRNDVNEARRELNTLPAADRAAAQGWIEKANARDAAIASSRQFAATAMSALAGPAP